MKFKSPLSQRIILSFVLLTTLVSGLSALGITATIHYVEEMLISAELRGDLMQAMQDYKHGRDLRLEEGTTFFTTGPTLPDYLRPVPPGYTEIVLREHAFYVYRIGDERASYFLVQDQTSFEKAETLLQTAVLTGFLLSMLASFILGRLLVNKVIAPVIKLTRQVAGRENSLTALPPLSDDYPDDEVGTLARTFDATLGKLQKALQRETLFTGDVSHELRTPLMVIDSSCEVLLTRNGLDPYARQKVLAIRNAGHEMGKLIEVFLALARGREFRPEGATLHAIVQSELPTWDRLAARKGNSLVLEDDTGGNPDGETEYPAVLLRTILGNLIRNASHHTLNGRIVLRLRQNGFEVRDTGTGIAADERPHVFDAYYRGANARPDSLGLGLSLVRRICERENWRITLEDNRPSGCSFQIEFS